MRLTRILILLVVLCAACSNSVPNPYPSIQPKSEALNPNPYPLPENTQLLFPVYNNRPLRGTEVWEGTVSKSIMKTYWQELKPDFVRMPIYWSHVEKWPDVYVWPVAYDNDVSYLKSQNILPVLTIKSAPSWARTVDQRLCGRPDHVEDFAEFAAAVAERYGGVIVIEIWNEPDTPLGENDIYGCWGDESAEDYGGSYYRQILEASYPAIKSANPNATVLAGALMLPCSGRCPMDKYLIAWSDAPYDGISFHHYSTTSDSVGLDEAITYLRQFTDRPLWLTETSIIAGVCNTQHEQRSVEWAKRVKSEWKLTAVSWFFLQPSEWYCVDLLYKDWTRKPVYYEWMP